MPDATITTYGFTDEAKIAGIYGQQGVDYILDDVSAPQDGYVLNQIIRDAEQTVIVRLPMFAPADLAGNDWVESRTTWIAAHLLSKRRGNEHYFEDLYDSALRELEAIATGEIAPPVEIPLRDNTYPAMSNIMINEKFNVTKVRVRSLDSVGGSKGFQHHAYGAWWGIF